MDTSIFLAKALGIYLVVISLGMMLNANKIRPLFQLMIKDTPLTYFGGIMALIIGILMILSHNVWEMDWPVIITIVGWISFLKGISIIFLPDFVISSSSKWLENRTAYYTTLLFTLIFGAILIYFGFGEVA